jgi:hypothetical protein
MDFGSQTLVIARHEEDISWAKDKNHVVIQKGHHLPNIGREISSWFYFILTNYETLQGEYIFAQGHPFDHARDILDGVTHTCKPNGSPEHPGLDIHKVAKELDLPILDEYVFLAGAQHKATAEQIKKRPYEWYAKAFLLSLNEEEQNPWIFERLIPYIYVV